MVTTTRLWCLALILATAAGMRANSQSISDRSTNSDLAPTLTKTCLITKNVQQLVDFYEPVLKLKAEWSGNTYAEFPMGNGVLAIFSAEAQEHYIPGASEAANNKSMVLEFKVADVDQEYRRLGSLVKIWVKPPTTQPWGTRSIYFRDPDGNLVDFYTPPKAQ
jgi:catechol 2,3-dioxygenase-like lactoylglutathione lyase family enzyme